MTPDFTSLSHHSRPASVARLRAAALIASCTCSLRECRRAVERMEAMRWVAKANLNLVRQRHLFLSSLPPEDQDDTAAPGSQTSAV